MKKFDYDPMHQYVEKERTRSLLIEAANGGSAADFWRRVFLLLFLGMIGGAYYFATQTPRGRDLVAAVTKDPLAAQRAARRAARQAAAQAAEQAGGSPQAQTMAAGAGNGGSGDPDDMQEMENLQKSQEAMGHQLEAFAEGKAPPPSPEAVRAAMTGQAPPAPVAVPPAPTPAPAAAATAAAPQAPATAAPPPLPREPASVTAPATLDRLAASAAAAPGAPPYVQISRIPPDYVQDRQEFPDLK